MKHVNHMPADVREFLEAFGLERDGASRASSDAEADIERSSDAARMSEIYQRSLARACLSELRLKKAA